MVLFVCRCKGRLNSSFLYSAPFPLLIPFRFTATAAAAADYLTKVINDHSFPELPLQPLLFRHLSQSPIITPPVVEAVLGRLFAGHANGLKALELFRFSLQQPQLGPSPRAFDTTLHVLCRMQEFDKAWQLMEEVSKDHPSLLTPKSLGIMVAKVVKFRSFDDALCTFDKMENKLFSKKEFGVNEFNALLRAFCAEKRMMEARAVFRRFYHRFLPNTQTLNILLLGFKEVGNMTALEVFYHDMVARGFKPDAVSYNIRIDAYCKRGRLSGALEMLEEMKRRSCRPTLQTMTTLIHGACIVRNAIRARTLFDELLSMNLTPDTAAYNALLGALVRTRNLKASKELMETMTEKGIECDDRTYYTMFWGLKKCRAVESFCELYKRMSDNNFVPKTNTVVMLMKYFCQNKLMNLGLSLWRYVLEKGCCPHMHALDLLATCLCDGGEVDKALQCLKQVVERGRRPSERSIKVIKEYLVQEDSGERLKEIENLLNRS